MMRMEMEMNVALAHGPRSSIALIMLHLNTTHV